MWETWEKEGLQDNHTEEDASPTILYHHTIAADDKFNGDSSMKLGIHM
jgi:hypothetical protein